jgi:hypothetical protein
MKTEFPQHAPHSALYGLGTAGAAIYYVSNATSFWPGVLGLLKALAWPAFLVYETLKSLHAQTYMLLNRFTSATLLKPLDTS